MSINVFAVRVVLLLAAAISAYASAGETVNCRVVGISDGDTLTCLTSAKEQIKVRLAEIDTPEKAQPYGTRSRQALSDLAFGKQVQLQVQDRDRYGRTVARVSVHGRDVSEAMIYQGAAWVYRAYNKDKPLLQVEAQAKAANRGLWSLPEADRLPPWEWRKGAKASTKVAQAPTTTSLQCGAKRYCKQMASCDEATFYLRQCGLGALDGDQDGKPCEAVCR